MKQPLVSIITVNYNQAKITYELLESLKTSTYQNFEVIVVDNASRENPAPHIHTHYPDVMVINSSKNLGFAGGNNLGIRAAKGDFLFFVNNDTEFTPELISTLLQTFEADPKTGMVSPKIKYFYHPNVIQYAGFTKINVLTARNKTVGKNEEDRAQHDTPSPTHYAHGAAMMIPKLAVELVGEMPEDFFLYYEEMDWCEQIKRAGFTVHYNAKATIYHKESMSVGKASPLKTYYITRNRILFMKRNNSKWSFLAFTLFFSFFTFPKWSLVYLLKRDFTQLSAFLKGVLWHFNKSYIIDIPIVKHKKATVNENQGKEVILND